MRFALVDNEKVEAQPGLRGVCQGCAGPMVAHCGTRRIWHWKHYSIANCDRWWESETEWHRRWKDRFPREWQEIKHHDALRDEIHIADVLTQHGVVIEFQHSHIQPVERAAREWFYKNLIWIVDGTRLKRDYTRFLEGMSKHSRKTKMQGYFLVDLPEKCFPADWLESRAPVIFDFRGLLTSDAPDPILDGLWCLLPGRAGHVAVVVGMDADGLVQALTERAQLLPLPHQEILALVENMSRPAGRPSMPLPPRIRPSPLRRSRRF